MDDILDKFCDPTWSTLNALHGFFHMGESSPMVVSINGCTPKWMVYNGKSNWNGWFLLFFGYVMINILENMLIISHPMWSIHVNPVLWQYIILSLTSWIYIYNIPVIFQMAPDIGHDEGAAVSEEDWDMILGGQVASPEVLGSIGYQQILKKKHVALSDKWYPIVNKHRPWKWPIFSGN